MKNIKKIIIEKEANKFRGKYLYENPYFDNEINKEIYASEFIADDIFGLVAMLINPYEHENFSFEKLNKTIIYINTPQLLEDGWMFIEDYAKANNYHRQYIYELIKKGKLEKMKLGKYTLVREKNN